MARTFCLEGCWNMVFELTAGSTSQNNSEDRCCFMAGKILCVKMMGQLKGFAGYGPNLKKLVSETAELSPLSLSFIHLLIESTMGQRLCRVLAMHKRRSQGRNSHWEMQTRNMFSRNTPVSRQQAEGNPLGLDKGKASQRRWFLERL